MPRLEKAQTNIDHNLLRIVNEHAADEGISVSSYLRKLIVDDLRKQEKISDEMLLEMASRR